MGAVSVMRLLHKVKIMGDRRMPVLGPDRPGGQRTPPGRPVQKKVAVKKPSKGRPTKARSGGKRLDELLGGGFPFRSSTLVEGPAFIGKDILLAQFIAEGIKFGIPALVVLTNSTTSKFRKRLVEMDYKLEEREKAGLLTYIDCHSKTVGLKGKNPFAIYLNGVEDLDTLSKSMNRFQSGFGERFFYHRMIFESLSSVLRAHGMNKTIDFLNSATTRSKSTKGIALFDLASGIHQQEEINSIEHSMDGSIIMKEEKGKHLMVIKGLSDVKSRDPVQYKFDETGLDIFGSFSYSYIK